MSRAPADAEASLTPSEGWHCSHLYYRFDRPALEHLTPAERAAGREQFIATLDPASAEAPARLQVSAVSGHKADFGLMLLDSDPLVIDSLHQRLMAGPLGRALVPTYSFVSITAVSEYLPTDAQYGQRLVETGWNSRGQAQQAQLKGNERPG